MNKLKVYESRQERQKPAVELLAQLKDGNFVRLQILDVQVCPELVRIVVAYEDIADIVRTSQPKLTKGVPS